MTYYGSIEKATFRAWFLEHAVEYCGDNNPVPAPALLVPPTILNHALLYGYVTNIKLFDLLLFQRHKAQYLC